MGVGERQSVLWDGIFLVRLAFSFSKAARLVFQKHGLLVFQLSKIS